jgi:putative glutamine amidotransferase
MTRPAIGLTLDAEPAGGYSKLPWYALRQNYCDVVTRAGGLPVLLPHEPEQAEAYLDRLDGLLVTGGAFDVDPALFGARARHPSVRTKDRRTAFELAIVTGALQREMVVLGICGGQQLLNVVLGGTLIHHQAAKEVGQGVVVNATAEDGVIEGIEHPGYRFCLGVQWHPEYLISPGDGRILEAFVAAAA